MSRRTGSLATLLLTAATATLALLSVPAHADWGPDGNTIKATTNTIPRVAACSDGASGTFVAWVESAIPGGGALYAQHVLSDGSLDPAWPAAGALACAVAAIPTELGALPDQLGGLYVWRLEGAALVVQRLDPAGLVPAGWPAGGRTLGSTDGDSPSPSVIEDGAHGFYAAWTDGGTGHPLAIHVGLGNTGAGEIGRAHV